VLTCVLVEDEPVLRGLLTEVLQSLPATQMLGSVGTAAEAIALCQEQVPDLLVLDLDLPDGCGLDVAMALAARRQDTQILVLSAEAGCFVCPSALRPLLRGVIDKIHAYEALPAEIDAILKGLA
jgi:Response regulator containing a CheY-like receiver domain and an HTH DNA-binding domain